MKTVPEAVLRRLREHGQEHILRWWDRIDDGERRELLAQVEEIDLSLLKRLYGERDREFPLPASDQIEPVTALRLDADTRVERRLGEEALARGEVAVLVVAGGQGSRLGFDQPKGMYPVGPVSNKTLFQLHAEKVLALRRRHGRPVPLLVMTSHATDEDTREYFTREGYFGLAPLEVHFFRQGTMPALDLGTGQLLLEAPGRLFTSPNGHGGTLTGLAESGLLDRLREDGVKHVYYFQVDNPLARVADPVFLGHHIGQRAEVSSKVIPKNSPTDKLGNLVLVDGRCTIIEYSDLPEDLARQTDASGRLRLWAGNPAIHIFTVDFLTRVTQGELRIPFHVARKKVPYLDETGQFVKPEKENALKFEMFIFDVLPLAERFTLVETTRAEEFEPLKNATGPDSPETVRRAQSDLAAGWLRKAGVAVPAGVPVEVCPLFALDAEELAGKVGRGLRIEGPTYLKATDEHR
jgi:UDP-N-acetylglucosamine/UDP-N-acetylgalactosamine diphosphorylase